MREDNAPNLLNKDLKTGLKKLSRARRVYRWFRMINNGVELILPANNRETISTKSNGIFISI